MIICKSPLLFLRRERQAEQSSLACKEICTETSRCVLLHAHRDLFKITLKKSIPTCGKWASDVPFEARTPQNQTYFNIIVRLNTDLVRNSLIAMILILKSNLCRAMI